jgi:hypothetical protein
MHLIILGLGLAAAAASSAPAPAPETASETRIIAVELREGERLVATPSLAVRWPARLSLSIQDFGLQPGRRPRRRRLFSQFRTSSDIRQRWTPARSAIIDRHPGRSGTPELHRRRRQDLTMSVEIC